jgi:type IV fimbrial biogenesis protein FimT
MRHQGMTLIELLTALAVVAVVGAFAVPGLQGIMRDSARAAAVNDFVHAIFLARSESIKRNRVVSLCRTFDGERCLYGAARWDEGWMVFVNLDKDESPVRDPGEPLLHIYRGWPGGSITSNRTAYSFRPQTQGAVNGTIVFCDPRGSRHSRAIIISHTGRPRVSGRDASGKPLACEEKA